MESSNQETSIRPPSGRVRDVEGLVRPRRTYQEGHCYPLGRRLTGADLESLVLEACPWVWFSPFLPQEHLQGTLVPLQTAYCREHRWGTVAAFTGRGTKGNSITLSRIISLLPPSGNTLFFTIFFSILSRESLYEEIMSLLR